MLDFPLINSKFSHHNIKHSFIFTTNSFNNILLLFPISSTASSQNEVLSHPPFLLHDLRHRNPLLQHPKVQHRPQRLFQPQDSTYHTGKADTAIDCQTFCASDDVCKSFAFGLVEGHSQPHCLLFKVSASEVPARKDGLHVFDKQCAADRVPTSAPTASEPWGSVPKKVLVRRSLKCNCAASGSASGGVEPFKTTTAATAKDCQALAKADSSCQSFLYGLPSGSSTPVCKLYKVVAVKVPARSDTLFVFDKGCSSKQVQSAPKATKAAEVKAEKPNNVVHKVYKTTKVQKPKAKATKVIKVESKQPKATKVQNSKPQATKAQYKDVAKATNENKNVKAENPKTLATNVRNNEHQATKVQAVEQQATQAEGKKSACKTTKGSAAQPKITQA
ncbi:hypothetical protein FMUND_3093 [Fusarium mundagurra]|uniref:Apple domain-containing protein n=1 Tax=Fusarium mundagurra TaxID=1567541 RepID=A0A8H6DLU2_9HYPO|nr:hypothetical protein FMUND_3093 [Fusarium mundagurra]